LKGATCNADTKFTDTTFPPNLTQFTAKLTRQVEIQLQMNIEKWERAQTLFPQLAV